MKMKILLVDDEHIVRRGMRTIIENVNPNWEVIGQESNGLGALQFMNKNVPDVLITDIRMASMDGIQLAKAAREKWPKLIILLVSGYGEFEFAKEAIRFGALDYLLKPTSPEDLVRALRKAEDVLYTYESIRVEAVIRREMEDAEATEGAKISTKHRLVEDAIKYMLRYYAQELTTRDVANILHLNANYFCDLFKKETGFTFLEYLTKIRIKAAERILREKVNVKVYELASMVGYADSKYFSKVFKNETGMIPSEYRKL